MGQQENMGLKAPQITLIATKPMKKAPNAATEANPRRVKVLNFAITEALADRFLWWSNAALILGAVAVLVGTIGTVAMTSAREQFANERISNNETETARANESAAKANERAAQSELALERYKAPRVSGLKESDLQLAVEELKGFAGTKFDAGIPLGNEECRQLLMVLENVLAAAKFDQQPWQDSNPGAVGLNRKEKPSVGAVVARGVIIEVDAKKHPSLWKVAQAMQKAFKDAGIEALATPDIATSATGEWLHLLVGEKST